MAPSSDGEPRVGWNVRAARRSRGMSLETLAGLTGRAYAMLGKNSDAVLELRQAERLSPAQTRHHPLIRELVTDMLTRARREAGGRDLRGLAWRMNLV